MEKILHLENIRELVTCPAGDGTPLSGKKILTAGVISDGAVLIKDEKIIAVGAKEKVQEKADKYPEKTRIDCSGCTVIPGFVDSHTHAVFNDTREKEFAMRIKGAAYLDILAAGGGILSSVESVRRASIDQLVERSLPRLEQLFAHGTTTVEIKSGYGLEPELELKMLKAIQRLGQLVPMDIIPTYCAPHALPPKWRDDPEGFLDQCLELIPYLVKEKLASFNDIFIEKGVFTVAQGRRYLESGIDMGLPAKFHADEIYPLGGAELAAELNAVSADHLLAASEAGLAAMAEQQVIATWLPGTLYSLMSKQYRLFENVLKTGVPMALASDYNPGSNYSYNMQTVISQGAFLMKIPVEAAINMTTINGAHALQLGADRGSLEVGKRADLLILDIPSHLHLGYHYGSNMVREVICKGHSYSIPKFRFN